MKQKLPYFQHALRKNHPTQTHLLKIIEEMNLAKEEGHLALYQQDLQYRQVIHTPLTKENTLRMNENTSRLLRNYLTSYKMEMSISHTIPQGKGIAIEILKGVIFPSSPHPCDRPSPFRPEKMRFSGEEIVSRAICKIFSILKVEWNKKQQENGCK